MRDSLCCFVKDISPSVDFGDFPLGYPDNFAKNPSVLGTDGFMFTAASDVITKTTSDN